MEGFNYFEYIVLPLLIALSRIGDVGIGTVRVMFVARGRRDIAALLGFFEVLIWIVVISQVLQNLNNFMCYIGYAGGFSLGTFIGMLIEDKLALGYVIIRTITLEKDSENIKKELINEGYGVTCVDAVGSTGEPLKLIYSVIKRKDIPEFKVIIQKTHPKAFYSIEDARASYEGIFPSDRSNNRLGRLFGRSHRKGK